MQTDGDEYDDKPVCDPTTPRSRKISSISEIFDSSMMFLNQSEWTEVEANEPSDNDFIHFSDKKKISEYLSTDCYISNFVRQVTKKNGHSVVCDNDIDGDYSLFDFPKDILFDIKSKCHQFANYGLNRLSNAFASTSLYQKFIFPLVPFKKSNRSVQNSFARSDSVSVLQKIKKLKIVSKNPYMSPLLASDEHLKQMPPVYFVVSFIIL